MALYNSFVVMTSTPGLLATFLVSRGIIKQVTHPVDQSTSFVGVIPGIEWVRVPNPIRLDDPNDSPLTEGPNYDTRACFLVKFAHEALELDADTDSPAGVPDVDDSPPTYTDYFDFSRFARWVKNNSTIQNAPANYTINGVWAGSAYKVTGQNVWVIRDNPERFGVWQ